MGKKNRGPSVKGAREVLNLVDQFKTTAKGDPNRGQFCAIVGAAVRNKVVEKDATGLPPEATSKALRGFPTGVNGSTRGACISTIRNAAQAVIDASTPAAE